LRRTTSGAYSVSLNNPAYLKCTDCHEVHGSNHAKLLPAKKNEGTANFTIPSNFPEKTFRSGGSTLLARDIDFTDYSSPASGKGFGTTGDPGDQHAPSGATTGLCDACHRYAGRANRGTDNVTNKTHTHEGIVGDLNQSSPSQMNFAKDCLECHDTHGTTNLEMVETTINTYGVTFTARTGANSFDPLEGGSTANVNSVCVVCHQSSVENPTLNVAHNFLTSTVNPDHKEDTNCATCHPHGTSADARKFGFPQAACNSCHGSVSDSTGMPGVSPADPGVYHTDANNPIGTRGGAGNDNTAHKIHVNYLVGKRGIAAASACYVCHKGGGAQEAGGHPGNPANQSFKTGTQPTAVPFVQVAMDNTGAVLNVSFGPGKPQPAYVGTPGMAASAANGWKTCSNTACHYGMSPSWSARTQTGGLTVNSPTVWPSGGTVAPGTQNRILDKIRLTADSAGFVSVSTLKVRLAAIATAQDNADITAVKFFEDANNDNVIDTPSLPLGGGKAVYSSGTRSYTRSGIGLTLPPGGTTYVLVVADIASSATGNRTIVTEAPDNTYVSSDARSIAFTSFTSETATVTAPANLTVGSPDSYPSGWVIGQSSANNMIDKIRLTADASGAVTVTMLKVRLTESAIADNTDISVKFFEDANLDGVIDNPSTPLGGGVAVYSSGDRGFTRSGMSLSLAAGQTKDVLVAVDVAAGAVVGHTIAMETLNAAYIASNAPITTFVPFQSNTFTVQYAPGTLSVIQGSTNPPYYGAYGVLTPPYLPAWYVGTGAINVISERIRMTATGGLVIVDNVWVKNIGTALNSTDIASVQYYDNPYITLRAYDGADFSGGQVLLGNGTFNAVDNTYRLSGINYWVTPSQTREIVAVFNSGTAYTVGQRKTFQTQVNNGYVQASYAASAPAITPFNGAVRTIGPVLKNGKFLSNITDWPLTVTTTPTGGTYSSTWISNVSATADNTGSGYSVLTNDATATARTYAGYHEQTLEMPIPRYYYVIYPSPITGQIRYMRTRTSGNTATTAYLYVDAVSSTNTVLSTWTVTAPASDNVWYTYTFPAIYLSSDIAKVRIRYSLTTPALANAGLGMRWDEISLSYGPYGSPSFAPPRSTGDTTAIRCDACHQFGPRDYPLDGSGHPTTGLYRDQYYYSSPGSHIKHGVGDPQNWATSAPTAADGVSCTPCHGDISGYDTATHIDGVRFVNSGFLGKGAGANGTWDNGTRTCSNVNCHGNQVTPAWGTGTTTCTGCHAGSGDVDDFAPTFWNNWPLLSRIDNAEWLYSGHGKASGTYAVSGNPAAAFGGSNPCSYCHDGSVPHEDATNPFRLKDQTAVVSSTPSWNATCLVCHLKTGNPGGYDPGAEGAGLKNASTASRVEKAHYGSDHTSTDKGGRFCYDCHDAHGDKTASGGNIYMIHTNVAKTTDNTAGYGRPTVVVSAVFTDNLSGTSYAKSSAPYNGICQVCHTTVRHYTSTSGDGHYAGTRCTACHTHDVGFDARCVDCHDNDGAKIIPAPLVAWSKGLRPIVPYGVTQGSYGSHLVARKTDAFGGVTDWNAQCEKCHTGHGGAGINVQVPMPPASWSDPSGRLSGTNMQTRLGFDNGAGSWSYAADNGVWLGGALTSGTTEAEICWSCHDQSANAVSEWGYNSKTTPSGFPVVLDTSPGNFPTQHDGTSNRVNAGWIWNSSYAGKVQDWTAGYWMNEYDNTLRNRITSVHTTSFDPAGQSSSVANNVDGGGAVNKTTPALENKSYIRCSYCHDVHDLGAAKGPPADAPDKGKPFLRGTWVGDPYPPELPPRTTYSYPTGAPRNSSANRDRGGFFIDQNSNWPTNNAAMNTLALTAGLCTLCHGTNVDTMKFYTGSTLWRTDMVNGHSNSTLGGTRSNARDIFDAGRGAGYGMAMQEYAGSSPCIGNSPELCKGNGSSCGACPESIVGNTGWYGSDYANWYTAGMIGGAEGAGSIAHKFTCSKCHSPHAARLPALLTHNCVDTTWGTPYNSTQDDRANNCHRKISTTDGWHKLAPGQ
jgi:predicted CxxxxCH...CXXCH cytochrome family protein